MISERTKSWVTVSPLGIMIERLTGLKPGARVAALNQNLTTTDANGKYTLTNLRPGPTRLVATLGVRFNLDQETVTVISGETVTQDFVLVRKGTRN